MLLYILSLAGKPVAKHRFKKTLAILIFIDDKGSIKESAVIFIGELPSGSRQTLACLKPVRY